MPRSALPTTRLAIVCAALLAVGTAPTDARAQDPAAVLAPGPLLGPFADSRVALVPAQLWRADTSAWSKVVVWGTLRLALDSAITDELQARGLGRRWAYPADVVRSAKRNPTYASDPYSLGVARWRGLAPKAGEVMPSVLADNLRPLTALGDTRFALIPVELRADGGSVVLRLVMVDTRGRTVFWAGDLLSPAGEKMIADLAVRVADLIIEP